MEQQNKPKKKIIYNKERYEQNKEEMLKYRRERYRTIHKKDLNIKVSTGTFTLYFDWFCFCLYNMIMYVIIGKQKCIQCDESKNLLDEKWIQYNYLDMTEMPHKTMTYLRMYCNSVPIVLNIKHSFSNFEEILRHFNQILTHFKHIWIIFIYHIYIIIIMLLLLYYCYYLLLF